MKVDWERFALDLAVAVATVIVSTATRPASQEQS